MKAMILAAGLGTRLKPWTDKHPKALALVNGKSLLQRNVEYLQKHGITEIIVNVHHFANQIIKAIEENKGWGSNISISDESETVLETGGGLKKAISYFKDEENFLVMNADILTDLNIHSLIQQYKKENPIATLAVSERKSSRYFLFNQQNELCGWKNVKTNEEKICRNESSLNSFAFSGIQILNKNIFNFLLPAEKFSLVDVYLQTCKTEKVIGFNHTGSLLLDVGKPESIELAEKQFI